MRSWFLLTYKVPREPSALRVQAWRKLQKLGALLLHDSVWVLPDTPANEHNLQWLAAEIREMGGEANLWRSQVLTDSGERQIVGRFSEASDQIYRQMLEDLATTSADKAALARRYQQARALDHFGSKLGEQVRKRLIEGSASKTKRKGKRR